MRSPERIRQRDVNLSHYIRKGSWWANSGYTFYGKPKRADLHLDEYGELTTHHEIVDSADYVIYSYSTPIAWHVPNVGWFVPDLKYSTQTTKHQNITRFGVGVIAGERDEKIFTG